jgi:hypothetical protein
MAMDILSFAVDAVKDFGDVDAYLYRVFCAGQWTLAP